MSDQHRESAAQVEPYFDRTPHPFGDGPVDPLVYDASPRALRQRTVNFAAKRLVDMRYVSHLDRTIAEQHFCWRPAVPPGGLAFRAGPEGQSELAAAQRRAPMRGLDPPRAEGRSRSAAEARTRPAQRRAGIGEPGRPQARRQWDPGVGEIARDKPAEAFRRDTGDLVLLAGDRHPLPDGGMVAGEMLHPEGMAQHHDGRGI